MEYKLVDPKDIGIWWTCPEKEVLIKRKHKESLVDYIVKNSWDKIPPVPILKLPKGERHKYVICDGHHRRYAAIKLNNKLPAIILENYEIGNPKLYEFVPAEQFFQLYKDYESKKSLSKHLKVRKISKI